MKTTVSIFLGILLAYTLITFVDSALKCERNVCDGYSLYHRMRVNYVQWQWDRAHPNIPEVDGPRFIE